MVSNQYCRNMQRGNRLSVEVELEVVDVADVLSSTKIGQPPCQDLQRSQECHGISNIVLLLWPLQNTTYRSHVIPAFHCLLRAFPSGAGTRSTKLRRGQPGSAKFWMPQEVRTNLSPQWKVRRVCGMLSAMFFQREPRRSISEVYMHRNIQASKLMFV